MASIAPRLVAPPPQPPIELRLRLVSASDEPVIRRGLATLGPVSRHRRYGSPAWDAERALRWVGELGDGRHVALGACTASGDPVGLARYVRDETTDEAEVGVTILDRWQGRGAGERLLLALVAEARRRSLARLVAEVQFDNRRAVRLARRLGAEPVHRTTGWVRYELRVGSEDAR